MQEICLIIPCYNEEKRLPAAEIISFLAQHSVCLLFVNDGSHDKTVSLLDSIQKKFPDKVKILSSANNLGKGEAVRTGVLESFKWKSFDLTGYFDADLSTPLQEVFLLQKNILEHRRSLAFGSRLLRAGASIQRSNTRHYFSRVFATFASLFLRLPVYDTQCGAKLMKTETAKKLFDTKFSSRWLFDIEIFFRLIAWKKRDGALQEIIEVPLNAWHDKKKSKVPFLYFLFAPVELLLIAIKYR